MAVTSIYVSFVQLGSRDAQSSLEFSEIGVPYYFNPT